MRPSSISGFQSQILIQLQDDRARFETAWEGCYPMALLEYPVEPINLTCNDMMWGTWFRSFQDRLTPETAPFQGVDACTINAGR